MPETRKLIEPTFRDQSMHMEEQGRSQTNFSVRVQFTIEQK